MRTRPSRQREVRETVIFQPISEPGGQTPTAAERGEPMRRGAGLTMIPSDHAAGQPWPVKFVARYDGYGPDVAQRKGSQFAFHSRNRVQRI